MLSTEAILVLSVSMAILAGDRDTRHKTRGTKLSNTPKRWEKKSRKGGEEGSEDQGRKEEGRVRGQATRREGDVISYIIKDQTEEE